MTLQEQIQQAKQNQKAQREFTKQERINIIQTYKHTASKTRTCYAYDITRKELEGVLKDGI